MTFKEEVCFEPARIYRRSLGLQDEKPLPAYCRGSFLSDGNTNVVPQGCGWIEGLACGGLIADLMRLRRATWHENGVRSRTEELGQSVVQASLEGDCLEVGIRGDDTDPA